MDVTKGFPPILSPRARVLLLGTLPSQQSLLKNEYYGHPRNAFWPIMGELFGAGLSLSYEQRKEVLVGEGVAVWDVLAASVRPGSTDAAIDMTSAKPNDFNWLFSYAPEIRFVGFNGLSAEKLFQQLVAPTLENGSNRQNCHVLPSTSPAYASMSFEEKLSRWQLVKIAATSSQP